MDVRAGLKRMEQPGFARTKPHSRTGTAVFSSSCIIIIIISPFFLSVLAIDLLHPLSLIFVLITGSKSH